MPAFYKVDKERRLILITGSDHITLHDALNLQERFRNDPEFDPTFAQLIDLTQVKKLDLEPGDVRKLSDNAVSLPGIRRAFLANSDVAFGLARMFETYREFANDPGTRAFRELDQALHWVLAEDEDSAKSR